MACSLVLGGLVAGGATRGSAQGWSAPHASERMTLPQGFEASLVAAEPLVRQPVAIEFDDRGRLWVIQYLQYPNPAGLTRVAVDRFSRTRYDRVPEPPPLGPRGADRITILEDLDGDGRMDHAHDFVDGLNLATGFAFGHGGVFVLNVPYLLFYPDRNRDDVPDADPEVLLSGFGMEDAHSVANSLTFGPDCWLYGCQGSTVTANVRGVEFQQGIWRYHPVTRRFELFCEGGGNSWGLDFDRIGRLLYSTNVGGHILLHGVQGAYYVKAFGKHGALHNPHAYGYFEHAPHRDFRGGHVTVGGIVYQGDSFPAQFRDTYIAGDLLGHGIYWHAIRPLGSTVKTAHGGELLMANDTWFAPTDITLGPDGAVYVADWHDARTAHPDPDAEWDRSNGRIYRIAAQGTPRAAPIDFALLSIDELLRLHRHASQWFVRRARNELARRCAAAEHPAGAEPAWITQLRRDFAAAALAAGDEVSALEALWSLNTCGGLDEPIAAQLLDSPHPAVRAWTVRLLADAEVVSTEMANRLDILAEQELDVSVRQQLASSAARLPAPQALPIINAGIVGDRDGDDPYLPLLWWWAVEKHSVSGRDEVLRRFVRPTPWKSALGKNVLLPRLVRRYAAERSREGLTSVVRLLEAAPSDADRHALWGPMLLGWQQQRRLSPQDDWLQEARQHEFAQVLLTTWRAAPRDRTLLQLGVALRLAQPLESARRGAFARQTDAAERVALLEMLQPIADPAWKEPAMELLSRDQPDAVRNAALRLLGQFDDPGLARHLIQLHAMSNSPALNASIRDVLLARPASAKAWLNAVDRGEAPATSTAIEEVRRVALFDDPELNALVAKHWGHLEAGTREEKLAEVRRLNNDLRAGEGNAAAGRHLYQKHCSACHQLFGEGSKVGPDLTSANRGDRDFLLVSLVDPSSVIRAEFVSLIVQTIDGRILTGLPITRDDASVTLVDGRGQRQTIPTAEIDELHDSPVSLMPENLYLPLTPQDLRDLFAYLQAKQWVARE